MTPASRDEPVEDSYLVTHAQEGYLDAFEELVRRHSSGAFAVAYRLVGDTATAQDIVQESFLAAWRGLPRYRAEASFTTWLYRIVTNRCLNQLQRGRPAQALSEAEQLADPRPGPPEAAQRAAQAHAVRTAIAGLPVAQRIPLVLTEYEGLSYAEVAAKTGSTVPAVRSQLFRARRALARTLQDWR